LVILLNHWEFLGIREFPLWRNFLVAIGKILPLIKLGGIFPIGEPRMGIYQSGFGFTKKLFYH